MTYQPIKRGMKEAVTRAELEAAAREGREPVANVKQIAWFDTKEMMPCVFGVIDGIVHSWYATGRYSAHVESLKDLFAPPRYEWQWNIINPNGIYKAITLHHQTAEEAAVGLDNGWRVERIEGSKRLVKGYETMSSKPNNPAAVDGAIDKARFERAPCYLCGYNGPGYYQPDTHPCAAKYHTAQQHEEPTT